MGIAEEILNQLGNKAIVMIGAKNFGKGKTPEGKEYLSFKIGRNSKGVTYIRIIYNSATDDYTMVYSNNRGIEIKSVDGIYFDQMHSSIEYNTGIYTHL